MEEMTSEPNVRLPFANRRMEGLQERLNVCESGRVRIEKKNEYGTIFTEEVDGHRAVHFSGLATGYTVRNVAKNISVRQDTFTGVVADVETIASQHGWGEVSVANDRTPPYCENKIINTGQGPRFAVYGTKSDLVGSRELVVIPLE